MSLQKIKTWIASLFGRSGIGYLTFRLSGYPSFPIHDYFLIVDLIIQNGDGVYAFSCTDKKSLASIIIRAFVGKKAKYSHSGLIIIDGYRDTKILHMKADGLHLDYLLDLMKEIDCMAIVKLPVSNIEIAKRRMQDIIEKSDVIQYDYETKLANGNKIYCSELVHIVCNGLVDDNDFREKLIAGRKIFDPDSVIASGGIIYETRR